MVVDLLARAGADPGAIALSQGTRRWTFAELDDEVSRRAGQLEGTIERVVPLVLGQVAADVVTLLAHWRLGLTPALLHPGLTEPELEAARRALAGVRGGGQAVLWTSGTEGSPRGVELSYEALDESARASAARLGLHADDTWLTSLSPAHVGGLALITRALLLGCRLVAEGPLQGRLPGGVTHVSVVPLQLRRLLDAHEADGPPSGLRCVLVGGARAPVDLLARAAEAGWPVAATYGLTEATSQVATAPPDLVAAEPGTVGAPLEGVDVRIGADGGIEVRGATLATRYVGGAVGTESAIAGPGGWHRTGDLGRIDEDGHLWVTGRRSDRIVTGGVTVDAAEVEEALALHPGVAAACVVGLPDQEWGERVAVWIEPAGAAPRPDELADELADFVKARVGGPKRPRLYHVAEGLPRGATGKIDRGAVRETLVRRGSL